MIPTAAGKMGILCCLPFAIGGGISKEAIPIETVNINKPNPDNRPGVKLNTPAGAMNHNVYCVRKCPVLEHKVIIMQISEEDEHGMQKLGANGEKKKRGHPDFEPGTS